MDRAPVYPVTKKGFFFLKVVVDQQQTENIASQFTVTATNLVIASNFQYPLSKGVTN